MCHLPNLSERAQSLLAQQATPEWQDWQWQLAHTLTAADCGVADCAVFPMRVTPYYAALADWRNPQDPILRQFMAAPEEGIVDGYSVDPFGETAHAAIAPGIKQRYADRMLAMMNVTCSTYCRHCTRRGLLDTARRAELETLVAAIKARPTVREVLLSGGDPLILSDDEVVRWVEAIATLPQIDAVRLCTRTPVVLPMRWTEALVKRLARFEKVWVQTQFNHPKELTPAVEQAVSRMVNHGLLVSNQSVLLRGINDDPEVMAALCAGLQRRRIRPYYIFVCDPIAGISHFRTTVDCAKQLRDYLLTHLGGLACPRVVADLPEANHKTDI